MTGDPGFTRAQRWLPLLVSSLIAIPAILRSRQWLASLWPQWHVLIEQLLLVVAGCATAAAIVAGVQMWRGAGVRD